MGHAMTGTAQNCEILGFRLSSLGSESNVVALLLAIEQ
jgi:hypothetical protein